jgi:hypothetical protein
MVHLVELAIEFAQAHLKPEGALVVKLFHGGGYDELVRLFRETFRVVKPFKPKASRDRVLRDLSGGSRFEARWPELTQVKGDQARVPIPCWRLWPRGKTNGSFA